MMPQATNQNAIHLADEQLLLAFANANSKEKAFEQLVDIYKEKLYWHIRRMVILHDDTDDLLQETFIKAWKYLPNFRAESSLYTWLYRIATNNVLTFLEKQKKQRIHIKSVAEGYLESAIKSSDSFDANALEWKLQLAIQQLPEKQRIVFTLRYYDEMKYEEMSNILDVTEGALKASYHIAAKKIQEYIINH